MMEIVLVGINAKYIHTNLAVQLLKKNAESRAIKIYEASINDSLNTIAQNLLHLNADIYGFSCYIWNIDIILKLCEVIKKSKPNSKILLGGPEVSDSSEEILEAYPFIDFIIVGEGENAFVNFLEAIENNLLFSKVEGLSYRIGKDIIKGSPASYTDINQLLFHYEKEMLQEYNGKIIYYESMRGCPFNCTYCMSARQNKVRVLPLERVFSEIDIFIESKVKQVKFVDRTFNFDITRAKKIISHIISKGGHTNFHFEVTGELFDEELIVLINSAPKGLIQFEIGIQSTNNRTLIAIERKNDVDLIKRNILELQKKENCHLHLDLIAGLPYETYAQFKESFNWLMLLKPDMLQLGFLKVLRGTKIRQDALLYEMQYTSFPPYEIISNKYISAQELNQLRCIENIVERYYNSKLFKLTLSTVFSYKNASDYFSFYEALSRYWNIKNYNNLGISRDYLYIILNAFFLKFYKDTRMEEYIKFDYLNNANKKILKIFTDKSIASKMAFEIVKSETFLKIMPDEYQKFTPKQIVKKVFFQYFSDEVTKKACECFKKKYHGNLCVFFDGTFETIN